MDIALFRAICGIRDKLRTLTCWTNLLLDKGRYSSVTLSLVLDDLNRASAVSPDNYNRVAVRR